MILGLIKIKNLYILIRLKILKSTSTVVSITILIYAYESTYFLTTIVCPPIVIHIGTNPGTTLLLHRAEEFLHQKLSYLQLIKPFSIIESEPLRTSFRL